MSTFLSRTALLTLSLALATGTARAGTFRQQVAADPHGEVDITNVSGSIVIRGWDKPTVSVTAELTNDRQRVVVRGGSGQTTVCVTTGAAGCSGWSWPGRARPARLVVHVPRNSEVDASAVSAGISSLGIEGAQHLQTVSGEIEAELGSADNEVKSVSGSIRLRGNGQDGKLNVANVSGDLAVSNVAGELDARTVNGRLTAQLTSARSALLHTTSGAIGLDARISPGGTVATETISGPQSIKVTAPSGFSYEVKTLSGHIEDCFGQQPTHNPYGPGSRLRGTHGAGGGHVRIMSLSGGISLCDH